MRAPFCRFMLLSFGGSHLLQIKIEKNGQSIKGPKI